MRSRPLPGSSPWSYAARGIIGIVFGLYMLLAPGLGLVAFVLAYGLFSLIEGVIAAVAAFFGTRRRRMDWALLLGGIAGIAVGLFFLFRPGLSIAAMSLLIAVWMIAVGISTIVSAIQYRKQITGEWLLVLIGLFPIGFGIFLLARPILAVTLLPVMIGSYAIFWGILLLGTAFSLWRRRDAVAEEPVRTAS